MRFLKKTLGVVAAKVGAPALGPTSTVTLAEEGRICRRLGFSSLTNLLALLLLAFSVGAHAQITTGTTADGFVYASRSGTVSITAFSGTAGAINIPSTVDGIPVASIGAYAFAFRSGVTVTIPASITNIGDCALASCFWITVSSQNPVYSSSVDGVLFNKSQTTLVQYPGARGPTGSSYTIPSSVTGIGDHAFYYSRLSSVTIPQTVTSIGNAAFFGCTLLNSVTIPKSVTSIGREPFALSYSLSSIAVDANNAAYSSADGILFNKNQTTLIQCPGYKTGAYTVPDGVVTIGTNAFFHCAHLTSVTIPSSVTTIGDGALANGPATSIVVNANNPAYCSVDGVLFDKNITTLVQCPAGKAGSYAIPNSVRVVGDNAFYLCEDLTSIAIPNSVVSIGARAFDWCSGLTGITIPQGVTSIGSYAFYSSGLTSVTIPAGVTTIGDNAFYHCLQLKSASFTGNAPTTGTSVFDSTASGFTVYYYNDKTGFTSPTWNGYSAVNVGDSSPVCNWLLSNGLPYNADIQSEPNGDGVSLLMAYALNLDPARNLSASIPRPVFTGSNMSLTYYAASEGVTYTVQTSTNLTNWDTTGVTLSGPDASNCCTATVPMADPRRFVRLVVTYSP